MERRKAKISAVCVSIIMILSILLTILGVYSSKNPLSNNGNGSGSGVTANLNYNEDDYVGRIGDLESYMREQGYEKLSSWVPIANKDKELASFLAQEGKYAGKNGYLTEDVVLDWTNFSQDSVARAALAPKSVGALNVQFDGCGYTVKLVTDSSGGGTSSVYPGVSIVDCKANNSITQGVVAGYDGVNGNPDDGKPSYRGNENQLVGYHSFGGLINVLGSDGTLKNFKFEIDSNHAFAYTDPSNNSQDGRLAAHIAFGGLVGFNDGGTIDNVSVVLKDGKKLYASANWGTNKSNIFSRRSVYAAVFQGLVVGVSDGGLITNVSGTLENNSGIRAQGTTAWWDESDRDFGQAGASLVGGIAGGLIGNSQLKNVYFSAGTNVSMDAIMEITNQYAGYDYTTGMYSNTKAVGGIVAVNIAGSISSAMVTGNLNCMLTNSYGNGSRYADGWTWFGSSEVEKDRVQVYSECIKDIYVAEGEQPTNMIYKNAEGGKNSNFPATLPDNPLISIKNTDKNSGYNAPQENMVNLMTKNYDNGYDTREIKYYFSHDAYEIVEEQKVPVYDKAMIFVPSGKLLWDLYGELVYDNLYRGATTEEIPKHYETTDAKIYLGNTGEGEIGFYAQVDANSKNDNLNIYENANVVGEFWQEMSDQSRAKRAGVEYSPLYYNGTSYQLKLKVDIGDGSGAKLYNNGLRIRNIGDLKNAKKFTGGEAVELYCEIADGNTKETTVAYVNTDRRLLITLDDVDGMDRTLEILKRDLIVTTTEGYVYGESTVFDNIQVTFGKSSKDPANSGLAKGEAMLWQETKFAQDSNGEVTIDLNVAGHQMLRPSTNNYVLKTLASEDIYNPSTTFIAYILPHEITVEDGIYIRGTAVDGKFEIVNNRDFGDDAINNQKRKIRISARFDDGHFTADGIRLTTADGKTFDFNKNNMTEYNTARGLYYIEYYVSNKLANSTSTEGLLTSISWINRVDRQYNVEINYADKSETYVNEHAYGDKITLQANPTTNEVFVGWKVLEGASNYSTLTNMDDNQQYISYSQVDFFKVVGNIKLEAVYVARDTSKYLQYYTNNYGAIVRTRQADSDVPSRMYILPDNMGWKFKEWQRIDAIEGLEGDRVVFFKTVYDGNSEPATVQLIQDGEVTWEHFGRAITLKAGRRYLVNDSLVRVNDTDLTIYAINNLIINDITEDPTEDSEFDTTSLRHRSFQYGDKLYINLTFTYGGFSQSYLTGSTEGMTPDEIRKLNKPTLKLSGFNENDFTEYVRQGNVYQLSIVISMQELECRFGNNTDIISTLTIIDPVNGEYQFENVLEILLKNKNFY